MKPIQAIDVDPVRQFGAGGVDKPRGLQNAALQQERKAARDAAERSAPAAVVSLSTPLVQPVTYARVQAADFSHASSSVHGSTADTTSTSASAVSSASSIQLGEGSSIHINSRVDDASGSSTIIVGDGSQVHINSRAGSTSGHDTLIVGDNAKVHINQRVDSDGGSDTIVVGDGATLHLNSRAGVDHGSDTLVVPDGTSRFIHERAEWSAVRTRDAEAPKLDARDARSWSAAHFVSAARPPQHDDHGIRARRGPERAAAVERPAHAQFDALAYMLHELVEKAPKLHETRDEKQALDASNDKERGNSLKADDVSERKGPKKPATDG